MLKYPKALFEIIVVSDHSTDETDNIVKKYESQGVLLISSSVRRGKTAGLNDALIKAKGDYIIFTDADAMFPEDTVTKMVNRLLENIALYGLGLPVVQYRRVKKYLETENPMDLIGGVKR